MKSRLVILGGNISLLVKTNVEVVVVVDFDLNDDDDGDCIEIPACSQVLHITKPRLIEKWC